MARKPLGATPRDEFLRVRTTASGKAQIVALAKKSGESISDYIRRLVKEDAARKGQK
jgi:hypothetical protein